MKFQKHLFDVISKDMILIRFDRRSNFEDWMEKLNNDSFMVYTFSVRDEGSGLKGVLGKTYDLLTMKCYDKAEFEKHFPHFPNAVGVGFGFDNIIPVPAPMVDHPLHYGGADNTYEAIKVIEAWKLDFALGNAVKYIARAGFKDKSKEKEDLEKARWYIDRRIYNLQHHTGK